MESSQPHRGIGTIEEVSKHHCFGCCHVFYVFCLTRCTRKLEFLYHVPLRLGRTNGWNILGCYWLVGGCCSGRIGALCKPADWQRKKHLDRFCAQCSWTVFNRFCSSGMVGFSISDSLLFGRFGRFGNSV